MLGNLFTVVAKVVIERNNSEFGCNELAVESIDRHCSLRLWSEESRVFLGERSIKPTRFVDRKVIDGCSFVISNGRQHHNVTEGVIQKFCNVNGPFQVALLRLLPHVMWRKVTLTFRFLKIDIESFKFFSLYLS